MGAEYNGESVTVGLENMDCGAVQAVERVSGVACESTEERYKGRLDSESQQDYKTSLRMSMGFVLDSIALPPSKTRRIKVLETIPVWFSYKVGGPRVTPDLVCINAETLEQADWHILLEDFRASETGRNNRLVQILDQMNYRVSMPVQKTWKSQINRENTVVVNIGTRSTTKTLWSLPSVPDQPRKHCGRYHRYQINRKNTVVVNVSTRSTAKTLWSLPLVPDQP
uniref:Uncharacterized protein n=1 Tax=Timema monikensis TaxID=170555 RepID=A0A7R9HT38_9NEOP|nr:unnamed protein product [Timema monikensis]